MHHHNVSNFGFANIPKNNKDHRLVSHPYKNNCLMSTVVMRVGSVCVHVCVCVCVCVCVFNKGRNDGGGSLRSLHVRGMRGGRSVI